MILLRNAMGEVEYLLSCNHTEGLKDVFHKVECELRSMCNNELEQLLQYPVNYLTPDAAKYLKTIEKVVKPYQWHHYKLVHLLMDIGYFWAKFYD